jgi:tetratricopeptide (TPR) repeat protein
MTMLRPLAWCLGLGAAATALTLGTGGAAGPLAAALVGGVGGAAGNFGHEVCKALDRRVVGKLLDGRSGIAENHVVSQALRLAQLKALGKVLERFDAARAGDRDPGRRSEAERFSAELTRFVVEQARPAELLTFAKGNEVSLRDRELRQAVLNALPDAFDQSLAARRMAGDKEAITESLRQIRQMVEAAVLAEFPLTLVSPGEELPAPFLALFAGTAVPDGWFDLFIRDAADRIKDAESKDGGAFEKIWNAEQTAMIKAIVEAHSEMLRDIKTDTEKLLAGQDELLRQQAESRAAFQQILANQYAQRAAGITPNPSLQDRHAIEEAITSRDPERRRAAYLARGILNMARATHELTLELRQLRPALDRFQQINDEFSDAMFEGDLLEFEGKLDEAINQYEKAVALRTSDGFAAVALANALMNRALKQAPDGQNWDPGRDEWGDSMCRVGSILLPFLEVGRTPSNPAYIPAVWSYALLWYHMAEAGVTKEEAIERSTQALITADQAEPNNPVTLRLLGRNFHKFTNVPSQAAENYFKRAIDADPSDSKQKFYYALFLTESGRDNEAATVFEQCLDVNPDDPHVLEAFAFLLSRQPASAGRAELMWKHALRISPNNAVGWKRYAKFLALLPGGASRAEEVLRKGLANRPNDGVLWCEYAVLLEEQPGRETEAIVAYDRVLTLSPDAVEPSVRSVMHKIVAGVFANPENAGVWIVNEGMTRNDPRLVIAGAWLGVLYAEDQEGALTLLKSLQEHFGKLVEFTRQSRSIAKAIAAGNRFATWLDPLSRVIAGELPVSELDRWDAWIAA